MKKHGTGQVLKDEEELPKTATAHTWDEEDEKALADENKDE
jgi:hypothetical protein